MCLTMRESQEFNYQLRRLIERVDVDRWRLITPASLHLPLIESRVVDERTARRWVRGEEPQDDRFARFWEADEPTATPAVPAPPTREGRPTHRFDRPMASPSRSTLRPGLILELARRR